MTAAFDNHDPVSPPSIVWIASIERVPASTAYVARAARRSLRVCASNPMTAPAAMDVRVIGIKAEGMDTPWGSSGGFGASSVTVMAA